MPIPPLERYRGEVPPPEAPTCHETLRYQFHEIMRRAYHSTLGLTDAEINIDPGHGAYSIGQLLVHQNNLLRVMLEALRPGATADLTPPDWGQKGAFRLEPLAEWREALYDRLRHTLADCNPGELMALRPNLPPPKWAEFPVLMRILRPLTDFATHVGQVNYARRQFDHPVGT